MMKHWLSGDKPWFRPKTIGYGAGLPIGWEGWALILSYMAAMIGLALLAETSAGTRLMGLIVVMILITAILLVVAKARTEGGWRWRSGDDD